CACWVGLGALVICASASTGYIAAVSQAMAVALVRVLIHMGVFQQKSPLEAGFSVIRNELVCRTRRDLRVGHFGLGLHGNGFGGIARGRRRFRDRGRSHCLSCRWRRDRGDRFRSAGRRLVAVVASHSVTGRNAEDRQCAYRQDVPHAVLLGIEITRQSALIESACQRTTDVPVSNTRTVRSR